MNDSVITSATVTDSGDLQFSYVDASGSISTTTVPVSTVGYVDTASTTNWTTSTSDYYYTTQKVARPDEYVKPINEEGEEKSKEMFLTVDKDLKKSDTIGWKLIHWQEEFLPGKGDVAVRVGFKAEDDAWLTSFGVFVEGSKWTGISIFVSPECDAAYTDPDDNLLVQAIMDILNANFKDSVELDTSSEEWKKYFGGAITNDDNSSTITIDPSIATWTGGPSWSSTCICSGVYDGSITTAASSASTLDVYYDSDKATYKIRC